MNKVETKGKSKFFILVIVLIFLFISASFYYQSLFKPVSTRASEEVVVNIPSGYSTHQIAKLLKEKNLIKNDWFFVWRAKILKADGKLKAGKYLLSQNMTVDQIIEKIAAGKSEMDVFKVTIPEGYTVKDIAKKLAQIGLVDEKKFLEVAQNGDFEYSFLKNIPRDRPNRLEGYLFPDTYFIPVNADEKEIINMMLKRFEEVYNTVIKDNAQRMGMTPDEIVIVASIVEKEAVLDRERPIIAGVIYNRLKKKMKLELCPTVEYALGTHKEVLSYQDLKVDSPYNTYEHYGLPIGPICNPGLKSIEAALNPSKHDYYYFVARGDGTHIFSRTYQEHLKAQREVEREQNKK